MAHTDRGSQYTSIRYTQRLAEIGIAASAGTTGDSYDNALAETINGLDKTELIKRRGPWRTVDHVSTPPPSTSTGSTTADCTSTASTSHPSNSRPPTTLNNEPSRPLSSHASKSPDSPGRFSSKELCSLGCVLGSVFLTHAPAGAPLFGVNRVAVKLNPPGQWCGAGDARLRGPLLYLDADVGAAATAEARLHDDLSAIVEADPEDL